MLDTLTKVASPTLKEEYIQSGGIKQYPQSSDLFCVGFFYHEGLDDRVMKCCLVVALCKVNQHL